MPDSKNQECAPRHTLQNETPEKDRSRHFSASVSTAATSGRYRPVCKADYDLPDCALRFAVRAESLLPAGVRNPSVKLSPARSLRDSHTCRKKTLSAHS